jgi:DNA polymerase III subunit gamma/tau
MSYQVLARKWRPRNFSTLVGQEHVVRALTHALTEQRLHHAYLFTGTRGVGKTTIARILAKSLNCESGITASPCGVCSACQEIDSGRFVDLLEVDAATNTRVDEMRQLLENAVYAPTRGRFKVYVIDEVHMLSNSAFNAMLKTLEEPPEHIKFILATTDPQKIPVTVLSRCLQFNLKQMPTAAISSHLQRILQAEGVTSDAAALALIARSAAGSMRDALSLLDQAIAHGAGSVDEAQVRAMLGTINTDFVLAILEAVVDADVSALLQIAGDLSLRSLSYGAALQELASLLTRLQIFQMVPASVDEDDPDLARIGPLAHALSPESIQLLYQIAVQGRQELALAPDEYSGFVMTLIRMHAFRPERVSDVLAKIPPARVASQRAPVTPAAPVERAAATGDPSVNSAPTAPRAPVQDPSSVSWNELVMTLPLTGLARELAQNCELRTLTAETCLLRLHGSQAHLQMKANIDKLQQALRETLGRPVLLKIELGQPEVETPALVDTREKRERQQVAIEAIEQDLFVREAIETLDASLLETSIKPIN